MNNQQIELPLKGRIKYENPEPEKSFFNFRPDVSALHSGFPIYFEVEGTNAVDFAKRMFFKTQNVTAIAVDLKRVNRNIDLQGLETEVLNNTANKRILSWQKVKSDTGASTETDFWVKLVAILGLGCLALIFIRAVVIRKPHRRNRNYSQALTIRRKRQR